MSEWSHMTDEQRKARSEYCKKWRLNRTREQKERENETRARWNEAHPEKRKEYKKKYKQLSTDGYVFKYYRRNARKTGRKMELNREYFVQLIAQECVYCGLPSHLNNMYGRNGVDRVDNTKDYTIENTVSCCFTCNHAKTNKTVDEWQAWLQRVSLFQLSKLQG